MTKLYIISSCSYTIFSVDKCVKGKGRTYADLRGKRHVRHATCLALCRRVSSSITSSSVRLPNTLCHSKCLFTLIRSRFGFRLQCGHRDFGTKWWKFRFGYFFQLTLRPPPCESCELVFLEIAFPSRR